MIADAMLVTSCPECKTTFRVSPEILQRADGRVRCGRCSVVFDGSASLRDLAEREPPLTSAVRDEPVNEPLEEKAEDAVHKPEVAEPEWLAPAPSHRPVWPWAIGVCLLTLVLGGQLIHRYRAELSVLPTVGPVIESLYARIGSEIAPSVDLDQYDLLDLTAAAQPLGEEPGWLMIETRVFNEGPTAQPYPYIFVRLLDRWDETIAGRYFGPDEYAVASVGDFDRMNAGSTVDAQFIIMDPGPSATGFELEICVPAAHSFLCESDIVNE